MTEIYWITRLCALSDISCIVSTLSGIGLLMCVIFSSIFGEEFSETAKPYTKALLITLVISAIGAIFIPNKRELAIIYGVGGTIDYVKQNHTAQQLPDKVVKALDAWLDEKGKE